MKLINKTTGVTLAENIGFADTFGKRLVGLLGKDSLPAGSALYLSPCLQVHTFFMRFTMDAVFVDARGKALKVLREMPPWRVSPWVTGASGVYEFAAGALAGKVKEGDELLLS
ncbi:MAG: DUF192 domain-containing protein [Elusimicrobiales bacterium]|nr:DUF192 domain-containing protein [Elusimicrobiales bacterium]